MSKQLSSGFLIRSGGKFLLCRSGDEYSGKWSVPKGHVEDGETTLDAAYRETLEETGLNLKSLPYVSVKKNFSHMYSLRNKDVVVFFADDPTGMLIDEPLFCNEIDGEPKEIDAYMWADVKNARSMITRSQQELFSKKMPWIADSKTSK